MEKRVFPAFFVVSSILLCLFVANTMVDASFLNEKGKSMFEKYSNPSSHWVGNSRSRKLLESISSTDRSTAQRLQGMQADSPRYTFFTSGMKLKRINNTFCYPDENGDCQWAMYGESVFLVSSVGFIIGILGLFIICPIFWIFRSCCFGGCKPSEGICCPGEPFNVVDGEGYKKRHVVILKIISWAILVIAIAFSILGFVGNAKLGGSVNDLVNVTIQSGHSILDEIRYIGNEIEILEQAGYTDMNISAAITSGADRGEEILEKIESFKGEIKKYNNYRQGVMLAAFLMSVILFAVVAFAALFSCAPLSFFMATVGFFALFIMWLSFSIHYPISVVLSDVCRELDAAAANQTGSNSTSFAGQFTSMLGECENIPEFVRLREIADEAYNQSFTTGCDALTQYCNLTVPCYGQSMSSYYYNKTGCPASNCSDFDPEENCTLSSLPTFLNSDIADYVLGCPDGFDPVTQTPQFNSPQSCPWNTSQPCQYMSQDVPLYVCQNLTYEPIELCHNTCRSSESRNISGLLVKGTNGLIAFGNLLENHIRPLLRCKQINEAVEQLQDILCIRFLNSLFYLTLSSGLLGALLVPGIIIGVLSTKRFNKANLQVYNFD